MNDDRYIRSIKDIEKIGNFDEDPSSDNLCRCFYA